MKNNSYSNSVGSIHEVGEFFWIPDDDFIGVDGVGPCGYEIHSSSVDIGCSVEVLKQIGNDEVVVKLIRETHGGAQAPNGAMFKLKTKIIDGWPEKIRSSHEKMAAKRALFMQLSGGSK